MKLYTFQKAQGSVLREHPHLTKTNASLLLAAHALFRGLKNYHIFGNMIIERRNGNTPYYIQLYHDMGSSLNGDPFLSSFKTSTAPLYTEPP